MTLGLPSCSFSCLSHSYRSATILVNIPLKVVSQFDTPSRSLGIFGLERIFLSSGFHVGSTFPFLLNSSSSCPPPRLPRVLRYGTSLIILKATWKLNLPRTGMFLKTLSCQPLGRPASAPSSITSPLTPNYRSRHVALLGFRGVIYPRIYPEKRGENKP